MVILFNSSPQPCCCCWIWTLSFMLLQQPLRREAVSRLFHRVVRLFSYLLSFVVYFPLTTSMVEAGMLPKQKLTPPGGEAARWLVLLHTTLQDRKSVV